MVTTNDDDLPESPDGISTSSKKAKLCFSLQPCRISSVQFPEELLYETFLRLPVKSLIRFRCVSKGMLRLIDSPLFIKNHNIHRSVIKVSDYDDYAIVLCQPRLHRLFSVNFDDNNPNLNRATAIELKSDFALEGRMEVMGWCCNGIFCFKNSHCYVFWNPSNGTFRKVNNCSSSSCLVSANVSMGYDCVNDDYKIIRFIVSETCLEVYSFRNDSWRKIPRDMDIPPGHYCFTSAVCLGGVIHWLWTNHTDKSMFIAAFDLAKETFTSLPLPLEARQLGLQPCHFTGFGGRLCITFFPRGYPLSEDGVQTISVMEKYGVESSWSRLYSFGNTPRRIGNLYFPNTKGRVLCNYRGLSWWDTRDGSFEDIEIPGLLNDQARLSWWDIRDGSFEDIEIPGLLNDQAPIPQLYFYEAYIYVRNLVRLDQTYV